MRYKCIQQGENVYATRADLELRSPLGCPCIGEIGKWDSMGQGLNPEKIGQYQYTVDYKLDV